MKPYLLGLLLLPPLIYLNGYNYGYNSCERRKERQLTPCAEAICRLAVKQPELVRTAYVLCLESNHEIPKWIRRVVVPSIFPTIELEKKRSNQ
jgi:hypothetical protein